jgi:23S rRNA (uracil1939-C5)-methyltransferase
VSIDCSHRPPCPGCPQLNTSPEVLSRLGVLGDFSVEHGITLDPLLYGPDTNFRVRAKLAVRGRVGNPKIGIFQEGTHRIVDIPHCPVHHPSINDAVASLKQCMRQLQIVPFVERPHLGLLRYVQVVVQRQTCAVQVTLVVTNSQHESLPAFCNALRRTMGDQLHSLWLNEHNGKGNEVFGKQFEHIAGPEFLDDPFLDHDLFFHPGSFGQSNMDLAEKMSAEITSLVPAGRKVLEFHSGVGAVGLGLLKNAASMVFNEISPHGLAGLELALAKMADRETPVKIVKGAAPAAIDEIDSSDIIICDPPRKGMEPVLVNALSKSQPEQLWLIYCGFDSFLRDASALLKPGILMLKKLQPVHLFPHTDHIEIVALFQGRDR